MESWCGDSTEGIIWDSGDFNQCFEHLALMAGSPLAVILLGGIVSALIHLVGASSSKLPRTHHEDESSPLLSDSTQGDQITLTSQIKRAESLASHDWRTTALSLLQLLLAAFESLALLLSNYKQRYIWYSGMTVLCTWLLVTSLLFYGAQRSSHIASWFASQRVRDPYTAEYVYERSSVPAPSQPVIASGSIIFFVFYGMCLVVRVIYIRSLVKDRVVPSGFMSILFVLACVQVWALLGLLYMCSTRKRIQTASNKQDVDEETDEVEKPVS
ncbi:hypothetical protein BJ742DRAFT_488977 [Cladochytrium replicatum]|nr:hypothetical protein BJ742DRAFT_488977 [Cladochytrium replicatum]